MRICAIVLARVVCSLSIFSSILLRVFAFIIVAVVFVCLIWLFGALHALAKFPQKFNSVVGLFQLAPVSRGGFKNVADANFKIWRVPLFVSSVIYNVFYKFNNSNKTIKFCTTPDDTIYKFRKII